MMQRDSDHHQNSMKAYQGQTDITASTHLRIALLVPPTAGFLRRACQGVVAYARLAGWRIGGMGITVAAAIDQGMPVDGVILNGPGHLLERHGIDPHTPTVCIGTDFAPWDRPRVFPDHQAIARLAFDHLSDLGLRHFAFSGDKHHAFSVFRRDAFVQAANQHQHQVIVKEHPLQNDAKLADFEKVVQTLAKWLSDLPKPCGVFACDDRRAAEITVAAAKAHVRIPDEVALLGVNDDDLLCLVTEPLLSSIAFSGYDTGFLAAETLDQLLKGDTPTTPKLISPSGVVERESTMFVDAEDEIIRRALRRIRSEATQQCLTVDDLLQELPVSRRSFNRRYLKETGENPKTTIMKLRMEHAKHLLLDTDLGVGQIAQAMGFSTSQKFSRFFRDQLNQTPTEFRRLRRMR